MLHSLSDLRVALDRGGAVDALDRERRTPLFYAVVEGDIASAAVLLRRGANPNARDRNLETPLHSVAREFQP
jgi:ankyrin repeat protein